MDDERRAANQDYQRWDDDVERQGEILSRPDLKRPSNPSVLQRFPNHSTRCRRHVAHSTRARKNATRSLMGTEGSQLLLSPRVPHAISPPHANDYLGAGAAEVGLVALMGRCFPTVD